MVREQMAERHFQVVNRFHRGGSNIAKRLHQVSDEFLSDGAIWVLHNPTAQNEIGNCFAADHLHTFFVIRMFPIIRLGVVNELVVWYEFCCHLIHLLVSLHRYLGQMY